MAVEEVKDDVVRAQAALLMRIPHLDEDARAGLFVLLETVITMLEKKDGCSITFADPLGDGFLSVLALGEQSLVEPIMQATTRVYESMRRSPAEFLQ